MARIYLRNITGISKFIFVKSKRLIISFFAGSDQRIWEILSLAYALLRRSVCMHATARPKQRGPGIGSSRHAARTVRLCVSHALDTTTEGCPRGHKHSILSPSRLYASYAATYTMLHALLRLHDRNNYCTSHHCCRYSPDAANALRLLGGAHVCSREGVKTCEKQLRDACVAIFYGRSLHRSCTN